MQRHRLPVVLDPNLAQWAPLGPKLPFGPLAQEAGLNCKSGPWLALWPLSVGKQKLGIQGRKAEFDPDVWSGRASQVGFVELAVGGLASMYPASGPTRWLSP